MLYLKFAIFCFKVMFNIKNFKDFLSYDGQKGKNHKLELKTIDNKIKSARRRGVNPKKEHLFLSMFYETMNAEDSKEKQEEMITLFCLLYLWHYSLDQVKSIDTSEEAQ